MNQSNANTRTIIGALGLPINNKGQILLTLRHAPHSRFWHRKWQIPGGEIEFGETPEQALAREMHEELGVSARILHPYPIVKSVVYERGTHIDLDVDVHIVLFCYLVEIGEQRISLEFDPERETSRFRWIDPKKVHDLPCLPLTKEFVEDAEKLISENKLVK